MLENLAFGSIEKRLLYLLSKLAQNFGTPDGEWIRLDVSLSQQDLANMIGSTRESVSVSMTELGEQGFIKKKRFRKIIWIHSEKIQSSLENE